MWKKNDPEPLAPQPATPPPARRQEARELATIGPSISIKGNLTGEEDLLIQGHIEGKVVLKKHSVTVGKSGRVKADIHGNGIRVEGEVHGNLYGAQEVVIRASGRVQGNLVAPRVTLENGSKFKGSIDMEPAGHDKERARKAQAAPPPKKPERAEIRTGARQQPLEQQATT